MGEAKRRRKQNIQALPLAPGTVPITKENVITACALCYVFMFLLKDREEDSWWCYCQEQSCLYPHGSYRNVFWWSLRILGDGRENEEEFFEYFAWKWREYEPTGHIRRDGPLW